MDFLNEVFFYFYYAGHGCADNRQWIVLNEKEQKKIFWPAEEKIKMFLSIADSNCKSLVVFDCCREDLIKARARVSEAFEELD